MKNVLLGLIALLGSSSSALALAASPIYVGEKVYVQVGHPANVNLLAVVTKIGEDLGEDTEIVVTYCDGLKYRFEEATGAIDGTIYWPAALEKADQTLACSPVSIN